MSNSELHLISHTLCPYVQRSVIVLTEKGIPFKRTDIDLADKPKWFKQISPMGKVPLLSVKDKALFESAVICEYLDETTPGSLHPTEPLEKARHRSWIEFGSGILNSIGALYNAKTAEEFESKRIEIKNKFQQLEGEIKTGRYFDGEKFHLIDAVFGPIFRYFDVFENFVDLSIFDKLSKVNTWRESLQKRKSVESAVSDEYSELLTKFLIERNSYLSSQI